MSPPGSVDRSDTIVAARYWRVTAQELATADMWDLQQLEILAEDADIVGHSASGSAGTGYESERALRHDTSWWGGRPGSGPDASTCFLGVEFDRPVVPTAITLIHPPGPHRARRVAVESSEDGRTWSTVTTSPCGGNADEHAGDTVFYAPVDSAAAARWRITASAPTHGFAWDVTQLQLLRAGERVDATLHASGDAGVGFGVEHAVDDGPEMWGGRADADGRVYVVVSADGSGSGEFEIDRIVLDQGPDHWTPSVVVERQDGDDWRVWRHIGGLGPGRNDLLLGPQPRRRSVSTETEPSASALSRDRFGDRRILVLIAAYRDPELPHTVADALAKAAYPEHVRFAICHQYDEDTIDQLAPWADDPRFRVEAVHHDDSGGCCWARNRTFALHDDEPYILQIDAHMRFAARWDVRYVEMLESTGAALPVLSSYPPRYELTDDAEARYDTESGAQRLYIDEVFDDLTTRQKTAPLTDDTRPEPSPTLAAGQLFTRGSFCRDVDYDPDIYFAGEEISLAARAFTHGYDLFAPTQNLVWHLYQHDHPKHWEDHGDHDALHRAASDRLRTLFRGDHTSLGRFGLGSVRTLAEFEDHAGVRLGARRIAPDGGVTIRIDRSVIEPRDDYDRFTVVLLDDGGNEVDRRDLHAPDVLGLIRDVVTLDSVAPAATDFALLPVTVGGRVGEVVVRPISAAGGLG